MFLTIITILLGGSQLLPSIEAPGSASAAHRSPEEVKTVAASNPARASTETDGADRKHTAAQAATHQDRIIDDPQNYEEFRGDASGTIQTKESAAAVEQQKAFITQALKNGEAEVWPEIMRIIQEITAKPPYRNDHPFAVFDAAKKERDLRLPNTLEVLRERVCLQNLPQFVREASYLDRLLLYEWASQFTWQLGVLNVFQPVFTPLEMSQTLAFLKIPAPRKSHIAEIYRKKVTDVYRDNPAPFPREIWRIVLDYGLPYVQWGCSIEQAVAIKKKLRAAIQNDDYYDSNLNLENCGVIDTRGLKGMRFGHANLKSNLITELRPHAFDFSAWTIHLSGNWVTTFGKHVFGNQPYLDRLSMPDMHLASLEPGMFFGPRFLTSLEAMGVYAEDVHPQVFKELYFLQRLWLRVRDIRVFLVAFQQQPDNCPFLWECSLVHSQGQTQVNQPVSLHQQCARHRDEIHRILKAIASHMNLAAHWNCRLHSDPKPTEQVGWELQRSISDADREVAGHAQQCDTLARQMREIVSYERAQEEARRAKIVDDANREKDKNNSLCTIS